MGRLHSLDLVSDVLHDRIIEIGSSQVRVALAGQHLELAVLDANQTAVERTASKIVHHNRLVLDVVRVPIRNSGCDGLWNALLNDQARFYTSLDGGINLLLTEVSRDSNHGSLHVIAIGSHSA